MLPTACLEASAASVNDGHATCVVPNAGDNAHAASWLRRGSYSDPVLNQSGIDLGPSEDHALGWRWPSSGFVSVNIA